MGERRLYLPASKSFFSLIQRLSHVHFTRWTAEGTLCTFSKRRALSRSMLSSTMIWVTPGLSALSVCPPFCFICRWKIWCLAVPIPAGRIYAVMPANVFPEIIKSTFYYKVEIIAAKYMYFYNSQSKIYSFSFLFWEQPVTSHSWGFFFSGGISFPCKALDLLTLGKAFIIPWWGSIFSPKGEQN